MHKNIGMHQEMSTFVNECKVSIHFKSIILTSLF